MWKHRGQARPDFADEPGPGQESVWDYPRPPAIAPSDRLVEVFDGDMLIARSRRARRVLETASPPTWYLPPEDVDTARLTPVDQTSFCEWKGAAAYWALANEAETPVGWSYPHPSQAFRDLAGWFAFYPVKLRCLVEGERVRPQGGGFYGGWVTDDIVGPWKGETGTGGW